MEQIRKAYTKDDWLTIIKLSRIPKIKAPLEPNLEILAMILQALKTRQTLVLCHGRKHQKLNLDYKTTEFMDYDEDVVPDYTDYNDIPLNSYDVVFAIHCPVYGYFKRNIRQILKPNGVYKIVTIYNDYMGMLYQLMAPGLGYILEKVIPDAIYETKKPNRKIAVFRMDSRNIPDMYYIPFEKRVNITIKAVNMYAVEGAVISMPELMNDMISKKFIRNLDVYEFWFNIFMLLEQFVLAVMSQHIKMDEAIKKLKEIGLDEAWIKK